MAKAGAQKIGRYLYRHRGTFPFRRQKVVSLKVWKVTPDFVFLLERTYYRGSMRRRFWRDELDGGFYGVFTSRLLAAIAEREAIEKAISQSRDRILWEKKQIARFKGKLSAINNKVARIKKEVKR